MRQLIILAIVLMLAQTAAASAPETMSYQGILRDAVGNAVPDATYSITFSLYDVETGGTALWTETQSVATADGIFSVTLGSVTPLSLAFDVPYWLGMQVESDPELSPRTELTSAPYAMRAKYGGLELPYSGSANSSSVPSFNAENPSGPAIKGSTDLTVDGTSAISATNLTGQIWAALGHRVGGATYGVYCPHPLYASSIESSGGINSPSGDGSFWAVHLNEFHLNNSPTAGHVLTSDALGYGTWQAPSEFSLPYSGSANSSAVPAFHAENPSGPAIKGSTDLTVDGTSAIAATALNGQIWGALGHRIGGTTYGLYCPHPVFTGDIESLDGDFQTVSTDGFRLETSPAVGYVLTSDASGNGTWQPASGSTDSDWTVSGTDMYSGVSGSVGIGTSTPERKLHVRDTVAGVSYPVKLDNPENDAGTAVGVLFKVDSGTESRGKGGLVYERTDTWNRGSFHFLQDSGVTYANPDLADAVMTIDNSGNVGIGTTTPSELLQVTGVVHSTSGGFKFPDGSVQTTSAEGGLSLPYVGSTSTGGYTFSVTNSGSGSGIFSNSPNGTALEASSGTDNAIWASTSAGDALHALTYNGRAIYAEDADGKTVTVCDPDFGVAATNSFTNKSAHLVGPSNAVYGEVNTGTAVYAKHNGSGNAVYANAPGGIGIEATSGTGTGVWATSGSGDAVHAISSTGRAGYFQGGIETDAFEMPTGASKGYVLTSDDYGAGTWQELDDDGDWVISGSNIYSGVSGRVGIGTSSPAVKLEVQGPARIKGLSWPSSGAGMELLYSPSAHKGYVQVYDRDSGTWGNLYLGNGLVGVGTGYPDVQLDVYSSTVTAIEAVSVVGRGVDATGNDIGVRGAGATGVEAEGGSIGIHATGTGYAGVFDGNVAVNGTLFKNAGSFRIDHPLDPDNKYLCHSFVESPDMMNIYNGNVVLDDDGEAWVQMPDWFEALNMDFRYQLTCIGGHAPVYISEEISGNGFSIAGGTAGLKVSWQVTGIRHDDFANENRVRVEVDK